MAYNKPEGAPPGYPQPAHFEAGPAGPGLQLDPRPQQYYGSDPQQSGYGPPANQGYYQQQPGPYYQQPYPPYPQQQPPMGYYQQQPPMGYYDNRGMGRGGGEGICAGILAAMACCCCFDLLI